MKREDSNVMMALGLGMVAIGGVVTYVHCNNRINSMEQTLNSITEGISRIAGDVDITVPEDMVKIAVAQAADNAANKAVDSAVSSIKNSVAKSMDERITGTIKEVYSSLEEDMRTKLLEKVNLASLENIENQVSDKVAQQVMKTMLSKVGNFGSSAASNKAEVAKFLAEKHYATWQIKDVLDSMD